MVVYHRKAVQDDWIVVALDAEPHELEEARIHHAALIHAQGPCRRSCRGWRGWDRDPS